MKKVVSGFISLALLLILGLYHSQSPKVINPSPSPVQQSSSSAVLGTSTGACQVINSLPDRFCTQGAVIKGVSVEQVCTRGYAKSVRDVTEEEKLEVYKEYGITTHSKGEYEIDHLISLELGGSNDLSNLWPESAEPRPGFHEKDQVENYLHDQVCSGAISLEEAQKEISENWLKVYNQIK